MTSPESFVGKWIIWRDGLDRLSGIASKYDADDDEYYLVARGLVHAHVWVPASNCSLDANEELTA